MTRLDLAGAERVDDRSALWLALHHHHRVAVGTLPLVEDDELSWSVAARCTLTDSVPGGFVVVAVEGDDVVGYALVCIENGPDDTYPVGQRYAELYSLSVAPQLRGRGIGTRLLDFVDEELARRSIEDLKVAVMVSNTDAERLVRAARATPGSLCKAP